MTNRSRRTLEVAASSSTLQPVISWEDAPTSRPDPASLLLALDRLDTPTQAVMIGYTAVDVAAERNAGLFTIAVTYGLEGECAGASGPDLLIASVGELLDYLPEAEL